MSNNIELEIIKFLQSFSNSDINNIMVLISSFFYYKMYIFIVFILYFFKFLRSSDIVLLIFSQFIILFIKNLIQRERPFVSNNQVKLLDTMDYDEFSFPSGHTFNAFLLIFLLERNKKIDLSIIAYLVGLSRVYLGVHYPSDVIAGYLLAKLVTKYY